MVGTCIVMIFIAGARISHFVVLGLLGVAGFVGLDCLCSISNKTNYIVFRSMGGSTWKWVSNHPIAICNWSWWIIWA